MTMYTYEFAAFTEEELLNAGSGNGSNLGYGDSFDMPATASATFVVTDNDSYLSGDSRRNENSNDRSYQTATITIDGEEAGNGGQIYGEKYFWVWGADSGQWFLMIEIEQEGTNDDYFTFYNAYGVPEDGETLIVSCGGNISCWQPNMNNLEGPPMAAPPVAVLDAITITEGESIGDADDDAQLNILSNDFDPDGEITLTEVNGAAPGEVITVTTEGGVTVDVTVDAAGNLSFDSGSAFDSLRLEESDTFALTYSIVDDDGNTATSTVTVTIEGEESPPDAIDDFITVSATESTGDTDGNVLDNDFDPEGDTLTVVEVNGDREAVAQTVAGSNGGTVSINTDGTFDFDANGEFESLRRGETAETTFEYSISDGRADEGVPKQNIVFVVDVSGSTSPAEFAGTEVGDQNGDGISNSVLDAEIAAYKALSAEIASLGLNEDKVDIGLVIFSGNNGSDQTGASEIVGTFKAGSSDLEDALNGLTDGGFTNFEAPMQQTVNWLDGVGATTADNNVVYFLSDGMQNRGGEWEDEVAQLENSFDASIVAIGVGDNAVLSELNTVDNTGGAEIVNNTDDLTAALIEGFQYDFTADDTATLTVTVVGENHGPEALNEAVTILEDGSVGPDASDSAQLNILDNDSDFDGDNVTILTVGGVAAGEEITVVTANNVTVTVTVDASGEINFDTNGAFDALSENQSDSFTLAYTVSDGFGGTADAVATVNIEGVDNPNLPPDAIDDFLSVLETETADTTPDGNVLDNDVDPEGDELTVVEVNGSADNVGTSIDGSIGGSVVINEDGTYEFNADGDFDYLAAGETAETTFEYSITDGVGSDSTPKQNIVFVIDVSGSTSPAAFAGTPVGDQNGDGVSNSVLDAEIASFKALSAEIASKGLDPSKVDIGLVIFSGSNSSDQTGASQIVGTFKAGSTDLDQALGGLTDGGFTNFEAPLQETINWFESVNATTDDNNIVYFLSDGKQNVGGAFDDEAAQIAATYDASLVAVGVGGNAVLDQLNLIDNTNGAQIVNSTDELTAALIEGAQIDNSVDDTATLTVTVTGINDLADGDETAEVDEGSGATTLAVNALTNTVDPDVGSNPSVTPIVEQAGSNGGEFTIEADGTITFDTNGDFDTLAEGDTATTSVTYTVTDGQGGEVQSTVTVTVNGVNDLADGGETAEVDEGSGETVLAVNALTNTVDPDVGSNPVVTPIVDATGSDGGTFSITSDGVITFNTDGDFDTLAEGDTATTSVTYTVTDGQGGEVQSTVTVTVNGVNDLDDGDETANVLEDSGVTALAVNALENVDDPDSDPVNIKIATLAGIALVSGMATAAGDTGGEFTFDEDGNVSFNTLGQFDDLTPGETMMTSITYEVTDGDGGTVPSTYTVTVTGVNDAPVAVDNLYEINEGDALTNANIILDENAGSDAGGVDNDPNGHDLTINSALGKDADGNLTVNIVSSSFVSVYTEGGVEVEVKLDQNGNLEVNSGSDIVAGPDGAPDEIKLVYDVVDQPLPGEGSAEVSTDTAEVTIKIADSAQPGGPEINVVFLVDAGVEATSNYASGNSLFSQSLAAMEQVVGGIQNTLAQYSATFDVDVGVFSFESQDVGDLPGDVQELESATALTDGSGTTFNLSTDFGSVMAAHETATGNTFGDNGSDFFDQGRSYYEKAFEAANGFFGANDDAAVDDTINLVYVLSTSEGADHGNGLEAPFQPIQFFDQDFLNANGVPGVTGNAALTDQLIETNFIHEATVDTLFFGANSAQGTAVHALEGAVLGLNPMEDVLGDGFIKTNASDFVTSVENGLTDELEIGRASCRERV